MTEAFHKVIPILRIFDVGKAREFYLEYLGFQLDWEHRFPDVAPVYMQVSRGALALHLSEHHGDACPGGTVYVEMTGLPDWHAELTAKNYGYLRPGLGHEEDGGCSLELLDPFGNRLRLVQRAVGCLPGGKPPVS